MVSFVSFVLTDGEASKRRALVLAALLLLIGSDSYAQASRPPVELGLGLSGIKSVQYEDLGIQNDSLAADLRVTAPLSPRFSVEGLMTLSRRTTGHSRGIEGFYLMQVKQRLVRHSRGAFHPFITYGALGYFSRERVNAYQIGRPDGPMVSFPAHWSSSVSPPVGAVVGAGVQRQVGNHLALRAEGQLITFLWIPLGARFSAQASIPFGGYSSR